MTDNTDSTDSTAALDRERVSIDDANADVRDADRAASRRSFLVLGAGAVGAVAGFQWLRGASRDDGIAWPLRRGLDASARVQRAALGSAGKVATHDPASVTEELRPNGDVGLDEFVNLVDPTQWLIGLHRDDEQLGTISLAAITALPASELTVDHKCIEGWSTVVTWKGTRLSHVLDAVRDTLGTKYAHVGFATPDGTYYVSLDRAAAHHPQTLVAWELDGQRLSSDHGAPLRLAVPTRYGIKSLKRIGSITVSQHRLPDYWAERGYDRDASF